MSDNLIYPEVEPEKFDKRALKLGIELETKEHITWGVKKQHYDNFNSVPKGQRQAILKKLKSSGKSIGEVALEEGLDAMVVADILYLNIKEVHLLNEESL